MQNIGHIVTVSIRYINTMLQINDEWYILQIDQAFSKQKTIYISPSAANYLVCIVDISEKYYAKPLS